MKQDACELPFSWHVTTTKVPMVNHLRIGRCDQKEPIIGCRANFESHKILNKLQKKKLNIQKKTKKQMLTFVSYFKEADVDIHSVEKKHETDVDICFRFL